ncbi:MAG TPA: branched-chain amino acid ABC transporter permease [Planctomycetota bacterium]|nr:branched-chain amino acid ABC transporter permease [Planctomycetota bacterium]
MIDFFTFLLIGLTVGCIYALIAVGYTMVYGIIKLINFAHGEFYMVGAFVGYYVLVLGFGAQIGGRELGLIPLLVATLAAGVATGVLAVIVERLVYRPLRKSGRIVALLAALGVSLFLQNAGQQTVGAKDRPFPNTMTLQRYPRFKLVAGDVKAGEVARRDISVVYSVPLEGGRLTLVENLAQRGNTISAESVEKLDEILRNAAREGVPAAIYAYPAVTVSNKDGIILIALALITLLLYLLVQHSRFGRAMRAVSHDFEAAELMGINVDRVIAGTFFIGAFVAGIGGTLGGGMYYSKLSPLMGLMFGLKAFVAAVIGGIGSIPGALVGGLALGIAEALVYGYVSFLYADAFTFGILILMLLVKPSGLMGKPSSDKL